MTDCFYLVKSFSPYPVHRIRIMYLSSIPLYLSQENSKITPAVSPFPRWVRGNQDLSVAVIFARYDARASNASKGGYTIVAD